MKRIIYLILILIWMITVFCFSNENAENSSNTSGKVVETIIEIFYKGISEEEKIEKVEILQPIVRKGAHLTIYTIGGILLFLFCNTYNLVLKKKILCAIIIGGIYAITDEMHQGIIPGRAPQIADVLIDTVGVSLRSMFYLYYIKINKKIRR